PGVTRHGGRHTAVRVADADIDKIGTLWLSMGVAAITVGTAQHAVDLRPAPRAGDIVVERSSQTFTHPCISYDPNGPPAMPMKTMPPKSLSRLPVRSSSVSPKSSL